LPELSGQRRRDRQVLRHLRQNTELIRRAPEFARDVDGGTYLQSFLVAAVVSILTTRLYLQLTGFPRLGGGLLHIAHLLWGGLFMLVGLVLLLAVLGKRAKYVGAVIGGLGFGLFIDELGKFITADNDYFFQPTVALIYVTFVVLFLTFRAIENRSLSHAEELANSADLVREIVLGGARRVEVSRALQLLDASGLQGPFADDLRAAIKSAVCLPEDRPSRTSRLAAQAWNAYDKLLAWAWFQRCVILVFIGQAILGLATIVTLATLRLDGRAAEASLASSLTSLISIALVAVGVAGLRASRLHAYRWFERSVLVSIFLTQVIVFWHNQFAALGGLIWNLALLAVLRFLIRQEQARHLAF
jgi:hypothetical protein